MIGLARLVSPRLGLVTVSPVSPPGVVPQARLLVTTSFGRRFSDIGPRVPRFTAVDDVSFLDRAHGWLVGWSVASVAVTVYRTINGGRTWHAKAVTHHTQNAGAVATVQFLSPRQGWLTNQQPTAPNASLYATKDGGATWRLVQDDLPEIAPVTFANARDAWQAGGEFSRSLFHSGDGGRTWTRAPLRVPPGERGASARYDLPAFFGSEILAPVTFRRRGEVDLAVYKSGDAGRRWRLVNMLKVAARNTHCTAFDLTAPLPVSLATTRSWWVGVYRSGGWFAYRTANAGRSWQLHLTAHAKPPAYCPSAQLQAVGSTKAWFTFLAGRTDRELYATSDAGQHWLRLRPP